MEITSRAYADVVVVTPTGRIDHATAEALERAVVPLLDPAAGSGAGLVFDLAGVGYVSSVGLRVLMIAARTMRERQRQLAVCALQTVVTEIFAISRFDRVLPVFPSLGDALQHCSAAAFTAWQDAAPA